MSKEGAIITRRALLLVMVCLTVGVQVWSYGIADVAVRLVSTTGVDNLLMATGPASGAISACPLILFAPKMVGRRVP